MTMTVGARSLDNEERSNFRDYMSLLSLSVDASMTVREAPSWPLFSLSQRAAWAAAILAIWGSRAESAFQ